jgi:hypothetical protein
MSENGLTLAISVLKFVMLSGITIGFLMNAVDEALAGRD